MQEGLRYAVPLLSLAAVLIVFLRSGPFAAFEGWVFSLLAALAALPLVASGTVHLVAPAMFLPLLPQWVPGRDWLIVLTGLFELAGAAGIFVPRVRRAAALALSIMMIAIFPANVYVAGKQVGGVAMPGVPARLAMQMVYIVLLLLVGFGMPGFGRRRTPGGSL